MIIFEYLHSISEMFCDIILCCLSSIHVMFSFYFHLLYVFIFIFLFLVYFL